VVEGLRDWIGEVILSSHFAPLLPPHIPVQSVLPLPPPRSSTLSLNAPFPTPSPFSPLHSLLISRNDGDTPFVRDKLIIPSLNCSISSTLMMDLNAMIGRLVITPSSIHPYRSNSLPRHTTPNILHPRDTGFVSHPPLLCLNKSWPLIQSVPPRSPMSTLPTAHRLFHLLHLPGFLTHTVVKSICYSVLKPLLILFHRLSNHADLSSRSLSDEHNPHLTPLLDHYLGLSNCSLRYSSILASYHPPRYHPPISLLLIDCGINT